MKKVNKTNKQKYNPKHTNYNKIVPKKKQDHRLKSFSYTRIKSCLFAFLLGLQLRSAQMALAAGDVSEVTNGLDVLKSLVLAAVGGVGVIFLAWGLLDFGTAYSAHETSQQSAAIKKVVGGIIMIAVPSILTALGAA